jgi:hypothetical protein
MTSDPEITQVVRSWLRSEPDGSAERVLEDVLSVLKGTPQRRSVMPARALKTRVSPPALAIAAAAVLIVTVLTLNLMGSVTPADVGASPSDHVVASPSANPRITPRPVPDQLVAGRNALSIDDINLSFVMPANWESFGSEFPNYITRSVAGPQGAEGQVMWTGYPPTGRFAGECAYLHDLNPAATVVALTEGVASVPGTEVVSRSDVSVGGRAATKVVLIVQDDVGCDPGFFFNYPNLHGGALWPETVPGDTVRVWIVDAGPRLLVIEGKTHPVISSTLEEQIQGIVDSIRFE